MAVITNNDLTNATDGDSGTGIFDQIMRTVELHLKEEYDEGRITADSYSNVYLNSLQSSMQQAVAFLLGRVEAEAKSNLISNQSLESKSNLNLLKAQLEKNWGYSVTFSSDGSLNLGSSTGTGMVDEQITEIKEKIDLLQSQDVLINEQIDTAISETAKNYEQIKASQDKTTRDNILNNITVSKITEEIDLLQSQDLEQIAATSRMNQESTVKVNDLNHSIAIKKQQEWELMEKNGGMSITYTYYANGVGGATATTTNLGSVVGPVVSTTFDTNGTSASIVGLDKEILERKDELITAQTLGFKTDAKNKLLKVMHEGYAVNLSIAGRGDVPEANQDAAIDQLAQDILNDLAGGSATVRIQNPDETPTGETTPPIL